MICICVFIVAIFAAPSQELPVISDETKALFYIESTRLQNAQGRFYNIYIATPIYTYKCLANRLDCKDGKNRITRIFYTLDGNAFFPNILNLIAKEPQLQQNLPIIVGIGHDSPLAFDRQQRSFDYTPFLSNSGNGAQIQSKDKSENKNNTSGKKMSVLDERFSGGGGIEIFLDFILNTLKPFVYKKVGKPSKELLFGHSFGGLFVLETMTYKSEAFTHFVCASPSLWWGNASFIPRYQQHLAKHKIANARIIFTRGSKEQGTHSSRIRLESTESADSINANNMDMATVIPSLEEVVAIYQNASKNPHNVSFVDFKDRTHGSSIPEAMRIGIESLMEQ